MRYFWFAAFVGLWSVFVGWVVGAACRRMYRSDGHEEYRARVRRIFDEGDR